jgi:hypothetical protein
MVFRRLMPLFEQYAPRETTEAMRSQFEVLNSLVSEQIRQGKSEWEQKGLRPEKQQIADQEKSLLDKLDHTGPSSERDELYFKLALLMLNKNDLKARDYVSKIDESEFRKRAQAWVDWGLAVGAIKKKAIETALELARKGELTHIQRVWVLTQSAKLLAKSDREKALSLLDDATDEARRIGGSDLYRPCSLLAIANALRLVETARVWDVLLEVINAANSTESFTGEGGELSITISTKSQILKKTEVVPDFDIKGIFGDIINDDYDRTLQLAAGFQGDTLRANVTIAIARSVLNKKRVQTPALQPATKQ